MYPRYIYYKTSSQHLVQYSSVVASKYNNTNDPVENLIRHGYICQGLSFKEPLCKLVTERTQLPTSHYSDFYYPHMAKSSKKSKHGDSSIVVNKKARHDYHIDEIFEAGVALSGWEVKSLRQGKVQLVDSYVLLKDGEAWLIGAQITPLTTASTHVIADPLRDRKLLLNRRELANLFSTVQQKGHTCIATKLYWKGHLVKCQIALARGKKEFDKRATTKEREWNIEKQRVLHRG